MSSSLPWIASSTMRTTGALHQSYKIFFLLLLLPSFFAYRPTTPAFRPHTTTGGVSTIASSFLRTPSFLPRRLRDVEHCNVLTLLNSYDPNAAESRSEDDDNSSNNNDQDGKQQQPEGDDSSSASYASSPNPPVWNWMSSGYDTGGGGSSPVQPVRVDGSIIPPEQPQPSRIRANFDNLFSGMPGMNDILDGRGGSPSAEEQGQTTADNNSGPPPLWQQSGAGQPKPQEESDSSKEEYWFWDERRQIEEKYAKLWEEMATDLEEQRVENPDNVPKNSEGVLKAVLQQEMESEIARARDQMAQARLEEYETDKKREFEANADVTDIKDQVTEQLLREQEEEWRRTEELNAQLDDFQQYEAEVTTREKDQLLDSMPKQDADLDEWALQRLEGMLESSQKRGDDQAITDILEDSIDDLRERLDKEQEKGAIQPETLKEWQMYRAISTRLNKQVEGAADEDIPEDFIASRLQSWKEFSVKEEQIRKEAGLSRGPDMPFWWQEAGKDPMEDLEDVEPQQQDQRSRSDVRREVNRQAIQALESLVRTSDPIRAENIKKELERLKQELEPRGYLDVDETELESDLDNGPVDLSDVFATQDTALEDSRQSSAAATGNAVLPAETGSPPPPPVTPFFSETDQPPPPPDAPVPPSPPPNTPFFSETDEPRRPKPQTPFFSEDAPESGLDFELDTSKLGTTDEQKLRAMYRRAGARTEEEQEAIRRQWQEFQRLEKEKRDQSGLTDEDGSALLDQANLKYDMSDVMKGDGDFDAEKVLASIGPRPARKKEGEQPISPAGPGATDADDLSANTSEDQQLRSDLDPAEVSDSLFRAVSAIGGGRNKDDPEAEAKQKAAYEEFTRKENELRQSLDGLSQDISAEIQPGDSFDDVEYATDALSSLPPRPSPQRRRPVDEAELSDNGGILAGKDGDDLDDEDEDDDSDDEKEGISSSSRDEFIPEWLRKEREVVRKRDGTSGQMGRFPGKDINEVFDDDYYEKNMRQLAEYERRRSGKKRQMGIDISDVLGNRQTEDYADYAYEDYYMRKQSWGSASFKARKADLLGYTELSVPDLNSLMDSKDSVYSTGVSQYMPRINKPFKEFGAVFRLEGVLVDITGFHLKAWKKVAENYGFNPPAPEDVQRASVVWPDIAVRDVFCWTDDRFLCREVGQFHRQVMREVFDEWMKENGISVPSASENKKQQGVGESFLSFESPAAEPLTSFSSEEDMMRMVSISWSQTAAECSLKPPDTEEIAAASKLNPDWAVREVFNWATEPEEVDKIVSCYQRIQKELVNGPQKVGELPAEQPSATYDSNSKNSGPLGIGESMFQSYKVGYSQSEPAGLDQNALLELQFMAWAKVAADNDVEPPLPEEVMAAAVLNDPEVVVRDGFGWADDASEVQVLAKSYAAYLSKLVEERTNVPTNVSPAPPSGVDTKQPNNSYPAQEKFGPTGDELLEIQTYAWSTTAERYGFQSPTQDEIRLAMDMEPKDAIKRLLRWDGNEDEISNMQSTYEDALKRASEKYIRKYQLKADASQEPKKKESETGPTRDDIFKASFDAWTAVAWKKGFKLPEKDEVEFALTVGPEEAITTGFQWTEDPEEVTDIASSYRAGLESSRAKWKGQAPASVKTEDKPIPLFSVVAGGDVWVKSLLDVEMQCGVVSYLDRDQVDVLLDQAGLSELFSADRRVSGSSGYNREAQQMLGAALRLERRPDHCVVFDSSPYASVAAHEVEMQNVNMIGPYPRYELLASDATASSFDELTAMNIRRLFGERIYDQPMLDTQQNQPDQRRQPKTSFLWEDD